MPVSAEQVSTLRTLNDGLVAIASRDIAQVYRATIPRGPAATQNALLRMTPVVVQQRGSVLASTTADWYDETRAANRVAGRYYAEPIDALNVEQVQARVRSASRHMWDDDPDLALNALLTSTGKYVRAFSRDTIVNATKGDPYATGWQRIASAGACDFCHVLAGRGGVYRRDTVGFAAHSACKCTAVPSWDPSAPEVPVEAYRQSSRRMSDSTRRRQNAQARQWIATNMH